MMFRVIGYIAFFVILVFFDLLIIGKKPNTFSVVWKKTTLYSVTFVLYIVLCYVLDLMLTKFGL